MKKLRKIGRKRAEQWLSEQAEVLHYYRKTEMNMTQIARLMRVSTAKVSAMLDDRAPKYVELYRQEIDA